MKLKAWIKASRLPCQLYILLPLMLGQAIAIYTENTFDWKLFTLILLYSVFIQLYIVYANDYADVDLDKKNNTFNMFSGGSRVLVEGLLSKREMRLGIFITILLNIVVGVVLTFVYGRILSIPLIVFSMMLLWAYSYRPISLSYRGGGEVLQVIGVGVVLPVFGYYIQTSEVISFPWQLLIVIVPTELACAFTTTLPDEPSDRTGNKRTVSVLFGPYQVRLFIIVLYFTALTLFPFVSIKNINGIRTVAVLLLPSIGLFVLLRYLRSAPASSSRLNAFVAISIAVTLSYVASIAADMLLPS